MQRKAERKPSARRHTGRSVFRGGGAGGKGLGVLWSLRTGMQLASGRGIPRGGVGSIRQG